jgi:hypothetical protein
MRAALRKIFNSTELKRHLGMMIVIINRGSFTFIYFYPAATNAGAIAQHQDRTAFRR